MTAPNTIFGIDLGTTYSAIAYVDEYGKPTVVMNKENTAVTPSVIYFESAENVLVGGPARESGRLDPSNCVELIKASMGDGEYRREIHGVEYRPEQLSALILKKLKEDTAELLGVPVTDAVITVPAYFNENQRTATENAGRIAGLTVHAIIPEPTAAAVAYAATEGGDQTLLVYDLGGGTFDVTVMQVSGSKVRVVCVDGNHDLGGRKWDEKVVLYLASEWRSQTGSEEDPLSDPETQQELFGKAEEAKKLLTQREKTPLRVSHAGHPVRIELTREKFEELTSDLLELTISLTHQVMAEAQKQSVGHIDKILLVGGSSYMPQVQNRLKSEFPGSAQELFEPEQAVAKGAALYAANKLIQDAYEQATRDVLRRDDVSGIDIDKLPLDKRTEIKKRVLKLSGVTADALDGGLGGMEIVNVCSKNFGIQVLDEDDRPVVDYLIRRNTPVPAECEREYPVDQANLSSVVIPVFESEGARPELDDPNDPACRKIKEIRLHLPAGSADGHPIQVKFSLSEDGGRLLVHARETLTGQEIEDSVEGADSLMEQEVEDMESRLRAVKLG